jgi:hypothetical protein
MPSPTDPAIDRLAASVTAISGAADSAVALLNGLGQMIRDAADDPAQVNALADLVDAKASELGAAVAANT